MGHQGQFRRTEATQLRDLEALRLRATGATLQQVGEALGEHKATVKKRVDRILGEVKFSAVEEYRQLELARLEAAVAKVSEILYGTHPYVSDGRVMPGIADVGPNLAAARELRQLSERISKLLGLDAPSRKIVEVITDDVLDVAIRNELLAMEALDATVGPDHRSVPGEASPSA